MIPHTLNYKSNVDGTVCTGIITQCKGIASTLNSRPQFLFLLEVSRRDVGLELSVDGTGKYNLDNN
jgi:hypothetical protein